MDVLGRGLLLVLGFVSVAQGHALRQWLCGCKPSSLPPVCGSDFRTYPNECEMNCGRDASNKLQVLYYGPCQTPPPQPVPAPLCGCNPSLPPVCGSDLRTYPNECEMNCGRDASNKLQVLSYGPCRLAPPPQPVPAPYPPYLNPDTQYPPFIYPEDEVLPVYPYKRNPSPMIAPSPFPLERQTVPQSAPVRLSNRFVPEPVPVPSRRAIYVPAPVPVPDNRDLPILVPDPASYPDPEPLPIPMPVPVPGPYPPGPLVPIPAPVPYPPEPYPYPPEPVPEPIPVPAPVPVDNPDDQNIVIPYPVPVNM